MRKAMLLVILLLILILVAYLGVSSYGAVTVMKISRVPLEQSPATVGLTYEDIAFPSRVDNVPLKGWYIPGGKFIIVVVNGGYHNRVDLTAGTLELSKDLVEAGYSVLLFDLRGRGESEGRGLVLAHTERDIGGVVDYVKARGYFTENIGIIGFSTGAASTLIFASQEKVAAIVADGCFAEVHSTLVNKIIEAKGLPELLVEFFTPGIFLMAKLIYGYEKVNPVDIVADISCPILFIHGEVDHIIPEDDAYKLYEASGNPLDELWVVPGANHCQGYNTDPVGYIERVASFLRE